MYIFHSVFNTDYAGLEIAVKLCIASPYSRQIAICNAGSTSALDSMGAKGQFQITGNNTCKGATIL